MNEFEKAISKIDERTGNVNDENVIESADDKDILSYSPNSKKLMTVSISRKRWINKIKEYAVKYPSEVVITHVNADGSIVAHVPIDYFHIYRPRELSEKSKEKLKENLNIASKNK